MIEYGEDQFPALLAQLDDALPLTYRRLRVFGLREDAGTVIVRVVEQDVELLCNAKQLNLYSVCAYGAFAYAVALALDDSRLVRLPLRSYDVVREIARVREVLKETAPWLGTIPLLVFAAAYQGEIIGAIELPARMARPDPFNARPEPAAGETEAQGMLRAAFGGDLRSYGRVVPGSA